MPGMGCPFPQRTNPRPRYPGRAGRGSHVRRTPRNGLMTFGAAPNQKPVRHRSLSNWPSRPPRFSPDPAPGSPCRIVPRQGTDNRREHAAAAILACCTLRTDRSGRAGGTGLPGQVRPDQDSAAERMTSFIRQSLSSPLVTSKCGHGEGGSRLDSPQALGETGAQTPTVAPGVTQLPPRDDGRPGPAPAAGEEPWSVCPVRGSASRLLVTSSGSRSKRMMGSTLVGPAGRIVVSSAATARTRWS